MTRLAIAADLHVDDFGTSVDPSTGWNARFEDGLAAVRFVAKTASERGAAALVIAGDYTEKRSPSPPRVARIREALLEGPRQVHVRGNHDQERSGRSIVDVLASTRGWEGHTTPGVTVVDDVAVCAIPFLGASYLRAQPGYETASAADVYRALGETYLTVARGLYARAIADGLTPILVGHQQLSGGRMNDTQAAFLGDMDTVIDSRALAAIGFAHVIFGHVHRAQLVLDDPACPVRFAGSTHRVDFAEEHEEKSFVVLDIEGGHVRNLELVPIPARRFVTLTGPEIEAGVTAGQVDGAIVRVRDLDPLWDAAALRRELEGAGAFEVQEIRTRPAEKPEVAGGMAEGLTAPEALATYFAGDEDAEALVPRGLEILQEVLA